jgi:tRNA threonylcarbamoyladenosine biosynthesis protein TsaB
MGANGIAKQIIDCIFDILPQQHSQQVLPMIDRMLIKHKLSVHDLDAIAYGRGPGSFTGVRIAASTVQGLALGADLPVLEISTLAAMAQEVYSKTGQTEVLCLIDARMQEVYLGHYSIKDGLAILNDAEQVVAPEQALEKLQSLGASTGLAGTGFAAYSELFSKAINQRSIGVEFPSAEFMLILAKEALNKGLAVDSAAIKPVYVRDTVTWKKLPHKA